MQFHCIDRYCMSCNTVELYIGSVHVSIQRSCTSENSALQFLNGFLIISVEITVSTC